MMSKISMTATPENSPAGSNQARRILFLDDDPIRAEIFLAANPEGVWVETASDCITRLAEEWDEVHLDHDLGGERFVDLSREDCGMEVVRWLCLEPHPHLKATRFLIHSHNSMAAEMMAMQIHVAGFQVESRPFGLATSLPPAEDACWSHRPGWQEWLARTVHSLARFLLGKPDPQAIRLETPDTDTRQREEP
jgi:hypothetical protein